MSVDVIIVAYNSEETISESVTSVGGDPVVESVVVVDNHSAHGSADIAEALGATVIRNTANPGFGAGCNLGAGGATARWILFLNPDAAMEPGSLAKLVAYGDVRPTVAAIGSEVVDSAGHREPVRRRFPAWWRAFAEPGLAARWDERYYRRQRRSAGSVDWVSGSALLVRREAFESVGGFDEGFFLYAEDIDLCARLRQAGFSIHWIPGCRSRHRSGASTGLLPAAGKEEWARGYRRYIRKHSAHPRLTTASLTAGLMARAAFWAGRGNRRAAQKWASAARIMGSRSARHPGAGPAGGTTA